MKISVVIPALNDRCRLEETVAFLRLTTAGNTDVEVIVADGGSADGTQASAHRIADTVVESPRSRAIQMHAGALAATGELLLFLHADTRLPEDWLSALLDAWGVRPCPGATAFRLGFDCDKPVYRLIAALGALRSRWTGVPHGDQAVACRREDYLRVGGFPPAPIMEEYLLLPKLAALGPVVILDEAIATSTRRYERNGPLFNALRNTSLIILFHLGMPLEKLRRLYT